jgi:hypothetical protein
MTDDCLIASRRADLVELLTATVAPFPVCDDIPNVLAADLTIVVTWARTRWDQQWLHTYDVLVIPSGTDAPSFFAARDTATGQIMRQLNTAQGIDRPTATTRTVNVAGRSIELCAAITVTATDNPISTGA